MLPVVCTLLGKKFYHRWFAFQVNPDASLRFAIVKCLFFFLKKRVTNIHCKSQSKGSKNRQRRAHMSVVEEGCRCGDRPRVQSACLLNEVAQDGCLSKGPFASTGEYM